MAGRAIVLKKETLLTGDYLSEARVQFDPGSGQPYVGIKFNTKGSRIFAQITEENINKQLAIVLDGEVYSAPVIRSKIVGRALSRAISTTTAPKAWPWFARGVSHAG
jgi:preprotein translocase subunit SecD